MSLVYLFRIVLLSLCVVLGVVDGRNWNSHQVAVGEWKVTLKGGWFFDPSRIFPPQTATTSTTNEIFRRRWNKGKNPVTFPTRRRVWGSSLDCSLSINDDGTFQLTPIFDVGNGNDEKSINNKNKSSNKRKGISSIIAKPSSSSSSEPPQIRRLPIRGQWKIQSNPYCVTDRFYDQLTLVSYPRVEVLQQDNNRNNKKILPIRSTIQLCLAGRMWGRYSKPKGRLNGRITHGALICTTEHHNNNNNLLLDGTTAKITTKKSQQKRPPSFHLRPVWASFSATRSSRISSVEGWDDQRYFGY